MYRYRGISMAIPPEVFHPGFFFSTKLLLQYLRQLPLQNRSLLELGAGSGLISLSAARAGAAVTATDINPIAIQYLQQNSRRNGIEMNIIESDLFDAIPFRGYDLVVINPPYYFKAPASMAEHAWYCGNEGEYFQRLFAGLGNYLHKKTVTLMILCEGCEQERIKGMAMEAGYHLHLVHSSRNLIERNDIYEIRKQETA